MKKNNFDWNTKQVKALGMVFHSHNIDTFKLNLHPKIEEFKNCLKQWEHRKLTLLGKITVIKSLALPKLIYPLSVLLSPDEKIIKEIKKYMFDFI